MGASWGWRAETWGVSSGSQVERECKEGRGDVSSLGGFCIMGTSASLRWLVVGRVIHLGAHWNHPRSFAKSQCPSHAPDNQSLDIDVSESPWGPPG